MLRWSFVALLLCWLWVGPCDAALGIQRSGWIGSGTGVVEGNAPGFVATVDVQLVSVSLYIGGTAVAVKLDYDNGVSVHIGESDNPVLAGVLVLDDFVSEYVLSVSATVASDQICSVAFTTNRGRTLTTNPTCIGTTTYSNFMAPDGSDFIGLDFRADEAGVFTDMRCVWRVQQDAQRMLHFTTSHPMYPATGDSFTAPAILSDVSVRLLILTVWGSDSIDGIEFEYSNGARVQHGSQTGTRQELTLQYDEYISSMGGKTLGISLFNWWFQTSQGRRIEGPVSSGSGVEFENVKGAEVWQDRDCVGDDLPSGHSVGVGSQEACTELCRAQPECTHWGWQANGQCWLKTNYCSNPTYTVGRVSGTRGAAPDQKWSIVGASGEANADHVTRASFAWREYQVNPRSALQTDDRFGTSGDATYFVSDFDRIGDSTRVVKTLRLYRFYNTITGFQFIYSDSDEADLDTVRAGYYDGNPTNIEDLELDYENGEHIITLQVMAGSLSNTPYSLCNLKITTNHGRTLGFGGCPDGTWHTFYYPPTEPGLSWQLMGMRGTYVPAEHCVKSVAPIWRMSLNTVQSARYQNVQLQFDKAITLDTHDTVVMEVSLENESGTDQTSELDRAYTASRTTSITDEFTSGWSLSTTTGFSVTLSTEGSALVASSSVSTTWSWEITAGIEFSRSNSRSLEATSEHTTTLKFIANVQPGTRTIGSAVGHWRVLEVPYEADVYVVLANNATETIRVHGKMRGSALRADISYSSEAL